MERREPSSEAIEAAHAEIDYAWGYPGSSTTAKDMTVKALQAAYAIDFAALRSELDRYKYLWEIETKRAQKAEGEHWNATTELVDLRSELQAARSELEIEKRCRIEWREQALNYQVQLAAAQEKK